MTKPKTDIYICEGERIVDGKRVYCASYLKSNFDEIIVSEADVGVLRYDLREALTRDGFEIGDIKTETPVSPITKTSLRKYSKLQNHDEISKLRKAILEK